MQFLGTAAADVLPGPLCSCPICQDARKNPMHRRLRSMFLLDQETLIDCGPDFAAAAMGLGLDLSPLKRVFITHTHEDHFCPSNAGLAHMSRTRPETPVDVYLSEAGYEMTVLLRKKLGQDYTYFDAVRDYDQGLVRLHPVKTKVPFQEGCWSIFAVDTTHRVSALETAINYRFERRDGLKLLYACDTGLYEEETLEALRGSRVDILIMEATWGSRNDKSARSHLSAASYLQMQRLLLSADIIGRDTRCYATHINHKHDFTHDALQAWFDANARIPVVVAFDGLKLD